METLPTNLKKRLLWCEKCKADHTTDEANAKCPVCGRPLYEVLYSLMDGSRITGVTK